MDYKTHVLIVCVTTVLVSKLVNGTGFHSFTTLDPVAHCMIVGSYVKAIASLKLRSADVGS